MGIGLSIIDQIAKLHKWSFAIEKNTPEGALFIIKIKR
jgi:signal transduction histidine kinase